MKRKLISAVALILCATMLLFCGCKSKKNNDDSTSPSESGAAVDAITDESTEPSTEGTTEPEKKESTPDAIKKVTDSTKKPGKYKLVPTDAENGYIVYYDLQYIDLSVADSAENLGKDKVIELASGRYIEFAGLKLVPYVEPKPTEPSSETSSETSSESSSETSSESDSDKDKDKDNDADTPKNNEAGDNNVGDNKN